MLKILFLSIFLLTQIFSSEIDNKIQDKKNILNKSINTKNRTELQIQLLAKQIDSQNNELKKLEQEINLVTKDIKEHQELLEKSKDELNQLSIKSEILQNQKKIMKRS